MVAMTLPYTDQGGGRWVFYLLLSVCVNGLIVSHVALNELEPPAIEMPVLQVNLMALAKPVVSPEPVPAPAPLPVVETPKMLPVITRPLVMKEQAVEKIVSHVAAPKPRQKPELSLPDTEEVVIKKPLIEPDKLPEKPVAEDIRPVKKVAEKVDVKPLPEEPLPSKTEVALSEASGATGQNESTVIQDARYRHQTPPVYPRRALDMGQQGTVTLHAKVLPNGNPGELKVARSSGHRLLDRAAVAAVKKWKFEPTSVNGTATVSWVRVPVNFVIQ